MLGGGNFWNWMQSFPEAPVLKLTIWNSASLTTWWLLRLSRFAREAVCFASRVGESGKNWTRVSLWLIWSICTLIQHSRWTSRGSDKVGAIDFPKRLLSIWSNATIDTNRFFRVIPSSSGRCFGYWRPWFVTWLVSMTVIVLWDTAFKMLCNKGNTVKILTLWPCAFPCLQPYPCRPINEATISNRTLKLELHNRFLQRCLGMNV